MCPAPSSTRVRSSSCPTLRTRASGCGICPKGLECRPSAGTTIASGCLGLTQTSTCLLLVGGECRLCLYEFNKVKGSQRSCFEYDAKFCVKISEFLLVKIAPPPAAEELLHINSHRNNEYMTVALRVCLCLFKVMTAAWLSSSWSVNVLHMPFTATCCTTWKTVSSASLTSTAARTLLSCNYAGRVISRICDM